jgi:hypothetical protein
MFFRRKIRHVPGWQERLDAARQAGFSVRILADGRAEISRNACVAVLRDVPGSTPRMESLGLLDRSEILTLVDSGYMKTFQGPGYIPRPALAGDLRLLHAFAEDLGQPLEIPSLYNESLGTVCGRHDYDRLSGR